MDFLNEEQRAQLNKAQRAHMRYLAILMPEQKCDCGWAKRGQCYGSCYGDASKGGGLRHMTDRQSILNLFEIGYRFEEADPHWRVLTPDGTLCATADSALCRALINRE